MKTQQGVILLEALIGILIFSMGILAMVGMQGAAVKHSIDAKNRSEASYFADQIIGQMWADRASLASYSYPTSGSVPCASGGGASSNAKVNAWLASIGSKLPTGDANRQQILLGANNLVTVTVCWKSPQEATFHNFVATAQING